MRETTFENAKVGDRVWTPFGPEVGVGETNASIIQVSKVNDTVMYFDIRADYNSGRYSIRVNGHSSDDSERTCYWSRPEIIAPERPVGNHQGMDTGADRPAPKEHAVEICRQRGI